jgi:hypothetical protein
MADDPTDGSEKDRNAPTVRELKGPGAASDTVPDLIGVYVPPRALPEVAQHRTMDLKSVRLSDYVDSRRALTERRLVSPLQQEPPPEARRKALWLVPVIVFALGIWAWLFIRESTSSVVVEPSRAPSSPTPVSTPAPIDSPAKSAPSAVSGTPTLVPEPPPTAASEPKVDEKVNAPAPAKTQRPREAEKKRINPWAE